MTAPWEAFRDARYFDLWCVRHSDGREFGAGFHLAHEAEAIGLREVRMWADGPINTTAAPTSPTARARGAATPPSALPATPAAASTLEPAGGALRGDFEGVA